MTGKSLVIVDYGIGNLFSVVGAVRAAGEPDPIISSDANDVATAERVILPGVGAFGDGMKNLQQRDLVSALRDRTAADRRTLGVCLGMQLLMDSSDEFGTHQGIGAIRGTVTQFPSDAGIKIPLIAWEPILEPEPGRWQSSVLSNIETKTHMYFVHSYYVRPMAGADVLSTTNFGSLKFCSAVKSGNTTGVQFHPERSGEHGIQVYRNFLSESE